MTHKIYNQYGKRIYGQDYNIIVNAIEKDRTSGIIDELRFNITKHFVDPEGNKITDVEFELIDNKDAL